MATGYRDDDQRAYDSQFHNDDPDMPPNDRYDETEIVAYDIVREGGGVIARVGTARLAAAFLRAEPGASHAEPVIVGALEALIDDLVEAAELVGESPNRAVYEAAKGEVRSARVDLAAAIAATLVTERCRGAALALGRKQANESTLCEPPPDLEAIIAEAAARHIGHSEAVGVVMRATNGRANPAEVARRIRAARSR